jgi:hypothetical protein
MNWSAGLVADVPAGVVTVMSTVLVAVVVAAGGLVTLIEASELTVIAVTFTVPKLTLVAAVKPLPSIVTAVPPAMGPVAGPAVVDIPVTEGITL